MTDEKIKSLILTKGCYKRLENEQIYNGWFKIKPKYLHHNITKFHLQDKRVLDIGCEYGSHLIYFNPDSLGLDVNDRYLPFSKSIGLSVKKVNFEDDIPVRPQSFDAVWCSNVLEHMVSPHALLLKLHRILKNDGLLFIYCPVISFSNLIPAPHYRDYLATEHINFYTARSLALTISRAGFKLIETNIAPTYNIMVNNVLSFIAVPFFPGVTVVAQKNHNFVYPGKRIADFTPQWMKHLDKRKL